MLAAARSVTLLVAHLTPAPAAAIVRATPPARGADPVLGRVKRLVDHALNIYTTKLEYMIAFVA